MTFVAPMMVFCFGIFYEALMLMYNEKKNKEQKIAEEAFAQMSVPEADKVKVLKDKSKQMQPAFLRRFFYFFLNPKVQIVFIFIFLFLSIGSLMTSYLVKDDVWGMSVFLSYKYLIRTSFCSYLLSIIFICIFVSSVITMKEMVEKNKTR